MAEQNQASQEKKNNNQNSSTKTQAGAQSSYAAKMKSKRPAKASKQSEEKDEFEQRILDIARVTRVMAGGKRMSFRACVAVGNKNGKVGVGLGKGADVTIAINKGVKKAKQNIVDVPIVDGTIPHEIFNKYGASKLLLKPARQGKGIIGGGSVRLVLELSGLTNVSSKILGTDNKMTNAKGVIEAFTKLKRVPANKGNNTEESTKQTVAENASKEKSEAGK
jgi:small subunit ribosomal protein S5